MTRIAMFHPAFETPGGAEFLCAQEARHLAVQGDDVAIVTLGFDAEIWKPKFEGIPVRVVKKRHWSDPFFGFSKLAKFQTRGRRAVRALADFEVAVAHNFPCSAMLGAGPLQLRKVWQCNEPPRGLHLRAANPRLTRQVEREKPGEDASSAFWRKNLIEHDDRIQAGHPLARLLAFDIGQVQKMDHIYAISEFSRDNARAIYGRCGQEVVYPMVRFPEGGRPRFGLDRQGLQVLVHSRLETLKNIDTVIRGFAGFRRTHPGARLHVVGEGPLKGDLEALARNLMTEDAVTFHGYLSVRDLQRVYELCDVFALLTLDEPFGMVFPEAAAKGLLLIGPDHGGPLEILEGGRLGWCVDPFSPAALTQALEEVCSLTDTEADRRRAEADRICRARFSEETIGPQLRRAILEGVG
jgi:glycosyltransferase involved in cell wall biosynthesis